MKAHRVARSDRKAFARETGWLWRRFGFWCGLPAFAWQAVFFGLSMYVILSTAFGTVDLFRNPVPVLQPWDWSFSQFDRALAQVLPPDGLFWQTYVRTFLYVFSAGALTLGVGYPIAYFLAFRGGSRRLLLLTLVIAPVWISYVMRMLAWQGLLADNGYINQLLMAIPGVHGPVQWLSGKAYTVIAGLVYGYAPYFILPVFAQLTRIDSQILEAARDLGADRVRAFLRVTLPLSRQGIAAGLIIVTLPMA